MSFPQVQQSLSVTSLLCFIPDVTLKQSFVVLLWPCQALQLSFSSSKKTTGSVLLLHRTPAGRDTFAVRSNPVDVVRINFNIPHSLIKRMRLCFKVSANQYNNNNDYYYFSSYYYYGRLYCKKVSSWIKSNCGPTGLGNYIIYKRRQKSYKG